MYDIDNNNNSGEDIIYQGVEMGNITYQGVDYERDKKYNSQYVGILEKTIEPQKQRKVLFNNQIMPPNLDEEIEDDRDLLDNMDKNNRTYSRSVNELDAGAIEIGDNKVFDPRALILSE